MMSYYLIFDRSEVKAVVGLVGLRATSTGAIFSKLITFSRSAVITYFFIGTPIFLVIMRADSALLFI